MSYSEKIKELREKHNLSQSELAEKLFVTRQAVSLWEQGKAEPSKDSLMILKELYGISVDEWMDVAEAEEGNSAMESKKPTIKKIVLLIACIVLCISFVTVATIDLVSRAQLLNPNGYDADIVITRKDSIRITQGNSDNVVFNENGKPLVMCQLPNNFEATSDTNGLYQSGSGTFIKFNTAYSENVTNPLQDSEYYSCYLDAGYESYIDMVQKSMYVDLSKVSVFSNIEDIYFAGGAKIIREQLCSGQNADYYAIDGGLTQDGKEMRMHGFALHFDADVWLITLKDYNNSYCYITIKDPTGIGSSVDTIGEFLSSLTFAN